ncbi:MAG: hypothetical protein U1E03_06220 [Hyphomonadaceae bacterium]
MKAAFGMAVVAVALFSAPAFAQTASGSCASFEAAPTAPNGATASRQAMEAYGRQFDAWRATRDQRLAACRVEIEAARAALDAMVQSYNTAGRERAALISAWNAEVDEYGARGGQRRDNGSPLSRPSNRGGD